MTPIPRVFGRPAVAIAAVGLLAAGLRFYQLDRPADRYFDEVYYSKDGCLYAGYSPRRCDIRSEDERYWIRTRGETSWVHPPLGKWMIAAGERAFGPDSFGWRFSAAVAGTATVVLGALIAQLLFRSALWTFLTGLLLATENLSFVQSRISMLDVFLALWVALGFCLLLLDRRWIGRRTPPGPEGTDELPPAAPPSPVLRPWRLAAGASFGAACATKWSGVLALGGAILLALAWERTRRARAGLRRPAWRAVQLEGFGIAIAFLVIPIALYLASWSGWFVDNGLRPGHLWELHAEIAGYHLGLETLEEGTGDPIHPYLSHPWTWILMIRPVAYLFESPGTEILGMGNPAIFWASLIAIPYLVVAWSSLWRRDWRAGFLLVAIGSQYLPWFLVSRPLFLFYMTPVAPFLVLATTYLLRDLSEIRLAGSRSHPFLPIAAGFVVISVAMFAFFWPVLTAAELSQGAWRIRMWFPGWV